MRRLRGLFCIICVICGEVAVANAQVSEIKFSANADALKPPAGLNFGEVTGIAVNAATHVFVYQRTSQRSTVHGATAAQRINKECTPCDLASSRSPRSPAR